jgi:hypothetical protein
VGGVVVLFTRFATPVDGGLDAAQGRGHRVSPC